MAQAPQPAILPLRGTQVLPAAATRHLSRHLQLITSHHAARLSAASIPVHLATMPSAPRPPARQPWPLWPIAVAIIVCLAGYTYFRLSFAKPNKPHEPFAESRQRALTEKLKAAGWEQIEIRFETITAPPAAPIPTVNVPARPSPVDELHRLSAENWHLPIEYTVLAAPGAVPAGNEIVVQFSALLDQARVQIIGFDLFRRGTDLVTIPRWEPHHAAASSIQTTAVGRITIPAAALPPGAYRLSVPALKSTALCDLIVSETPAP